MTYDEWKLDSPPSDPPPCCETDDHVWEREYYGHKCTKCGEFIPFGSEPWLDDDDDEHGDWDQNDARDFQDRSSDFETDDE